jgi:hypothetical protein
MSGYTINPPRTPAVDDKGRLTPEWYRFLSRTRDVSDAAFLTTEPITVLGGARVIAPTAGDLTATDGGAGGSYALSLANVVTGATLGAATKTVSVTFDNKGRITAAAEYTLNTDNVTEGVTNLYFTNARARAAISATGNVAYNSTTGVISLTLPGGTTNFLRADGVWAAPGGGGGYSYTVTTRNVSYSETATSGDQVVLVTGAAVTATLPTAVGNTARFTFKLMVAGTMTLDGAGAETIDGAATASTAVQYTAITIVSDNANWVIV